MSDAGRSGDVTLADVADGSRIGFVHSAETTSGVNGPGLRYTVFLSGCPLRCLYCHNPDTQTMRLGERTTVRRVIENGGGRISVESELNTGTTFRFKLPRA